MKEMEVTRRAAGFLVWGHIGWLQVTETQLKLLLTLEHHGFELCGSTSIRMFFNQYTVGLPYLWVLRPWVQPTMDQIWYF